MHDVSESRQRRLALNESLVRDVNERISDGAQRLGIEGVTHFLCECADDSCSDRVPLTLDDYERVRSHGGCFVLVPGHEIPEVEAVLEAGETYVVVQKLGEGGKVAEDLDPRQ